MDNGRRSRPALRRGPDGYVLGEDMTRTLKEENAWAVYIDNDTMEVLWHSEDLPEESPCNIPCPIFPA